MPRARTEEKRREIVRIASRLFDELGYEQTSMTSISERLGGSKTTLYGYFRSKEELLRAVLQRQVETEFDKLLHELQEQPELRESLIRLGIAYQKKRLSTLAVANFRCIVNQAPASSIGKEFYEAVIQPAHRQLANQFEALMDDGRLRRADSWVALMHWKGLNDCGFFERRLIGAISGPEDVDIINVATLAADAFLAMYGAGEPETSNQELAPAGELRLERGTGGRDAHVDLARR